MKTVENSLSVPAVDALVKKIQDEILEGKQRMELAVENEKAITYWKIGRHINEHLLKQDRAGYGDELFKRLSEKLAINKPVFEYDVYSSTKILEKKLPFKIFKLYNQF